MLPQMLFGTGQKSEWIDKWADGQVKDGQTDRQTLSKEEQRTFPTQSPLLVKEERTITEDWEETGGLGFCASTDFVKITARDKRVEL